MFGRMISSMFGVLAAIAAMVAMLVAFVIFVLAAIAAVVAVVVAIVAFIKREQWTKPAYRWTRDKTGQWSMTPWGPGTDLSETTPFDRAA